ncbi:hypothetical protein D3C76_563420 [compost metagenome]
MSRSRRKNPIRGITTAASESFDKAIWHRAFRRAESQRLAASPYSKPHHIREFSDTWSMSKDGKCYWGSKYRDAKWLKK